MGRIIRQAGAFFAARPAIDGKSTARVSPRYGLIAFASSLVIARPGPLRAMSADVGGRVN